MSKADKIAKTQAEKNEAHVAEFIKEYEALCRRFGLVLGITIGETFVVVSPDSQRSLDSRLKDQVKSLTDTPHQEW